MEGGGTEGVYLFYDKQENLEREENTLTDDENLSCATLPPYLPHAGSMTGGVDVCDWVSSLFDALILATNIHFFSSIKWEGD